MGRVGSCTPLRPTERARLCRSANRASWAEVYWQPRSSRR
jgi:hypothetical protein